MTRRRFTTLLTLLVLSGAFAVVVLRRRAPPAPASPQDAVYAMLEAARAGDLDAYLNSLAGPQAEAASQTLRETGRDAFRASLQQSQAHIKGIALRDPQFTSDSQCRIEAEYVFAGRKETQEILLSRRGGPWRIESLGPARPLPVSVPYGAPVQ